MGGGGETGCEGERAPWEPRPPLPPSPPYSLLSGPAWGGGAGGNADNRAKASLMSWGERRPPPCGVANAFLAPAAPQASVRSPLPPVLFRVLDMP